MGDDVAGIIRQALGTGGMGGMGRGGFGRGMF